MKHEIHYPILIQLGLNETETLIYEILLELGPKTAQQLIEPTGLKRGNLYNSLNTLKEKGVVFEEPGKKTLFKAEDPEKLRTLAKKQVDKAQALFNQLEAALPGLKSHYQLITKKPTIRLFEGIGGLKEIYLETLKDADDIYALVGPESPAPELYKWLTNTYINKRVKAGIPAYVVAAGEQKAERYQEESAEKMRTVVLLDNQQYPFYGEIDIFGDSIAFISYKKEELVGVIIESPSLAKTLRSAIKALMFAYGHKNIGTTQHS